MVEVFEVKEDTITISLETYERLLKGSIFLSCLEAAGVDNWGGYDMAYELMEEGDIKF